MNTLIIGNINKGIKNNIRNFDFKIFLYLYAILDTEDYIVIKQADIARYLMVDKSELSRSLRKLIESGMILRNSERGYKINSDVYEDEI